MSSIESPDFSSSSRVAAPISVTARLKTSRPLGMRTVWSFAATVASEAGVRVPPAGIHRISAASPSAPRTAPSNPGVSEARTTAAPAPSPNRMQVPRSV